MFVGIDVASERLDVAFGEAGPARTYANDIPGLEALNQTLIDERETIELIVLEATGGYESLLVATRKSQASGHRRKPAASTRLREKPGTVG
jgi:transposase